MSNYNGTVSGIADILEQIVHNLDAQVDQLTAAATTADAELLERDLGNAHFHRDLVEAFSEIANARAHLVNAHGEIMGTVPSYLSRRVL